MKKTLTLLFCLIGFISFGQKQVPPYYLIENNDTIGIVLSIEQSQKIDNDLEMLKLLKQLQIDCDNVDGVYVQVINSLGDQVSLLQVNQAFLESKISKKDDELRNVRSALAKCQEADTLSTDIEKVYKDEIVELKREVRRQKIDKGISIGVNILQVVATLLFLIKN
jgi:microsomal dipeptidase-like Zn-dependent dipeptidase